MQMNYKEVEKNLRELNKVVYAFEKVIEASNYINRNNSRVEHTPYLHIPVAVLRKEINELNAKIEDLKSKAVVSYSEDTSYIDVLLESKEDNNDIE